ncbi:hypothetical protein [Streptomyces sp. NPDC002788]
MATGKGSADPDPSILLFQGVFAREAQLSPITLNAWHRRLAEAPG